MTKIYEMMPDIQGDEALFLQKITDNYDEENLRKFASIYRARRKDPTLILILCIVGLLGIAGIHRILLNQIGMGILYFFTAGLCLIGTIVDIANYQSLTFNYNRQIAIEVHQLLGGTRM